MFPVNLLPIDAYVKVMDEPHIYLKEFTPTTLEEDLKSGEPNKLIYWSPEVIDRLYEIACEKGNYVKYLSDFNPRNYLIFKEIFKQTNKKLDILRYSKLNENVLGEIKIKQGKIKPEVL